MLERFATHNLFKESPSDFIRLDPNLSALSKLTYQYDFKWWQELSLDTPGIYILTGGRQVGKSTSCKLLIKECLTNERFSPNTIFYLPCDEIFSAQELSQIIRNFFNTLSASPFLLIIDEITFVPNWDRVIKALADEGYFKQGLCILTGSDTLILKEAAMSFPGRRGQASTVDFHLYPLSFAEFVSLKKQNQASATVLGQLFNEYLKCGGYLRAINDLAQYGDVTQATYLTYEQWIRGDLLKQRKSEDTLLAIVQALLTIGVSQISYSSLTQKIGLVSKETCIDYCRLLERMDVLLHLQAYDTNKKQGFPRKALKFHFADPFIYQTLARWIHREKQYNAQIHDSNLVEATVASHCKRLGKTFYFKGQGEVDVIWLYQNLVHAIEVKWSEQLRPADLKTLKHFHHGVILTKTPANGTIDHIKAIPAHQFLKELPQLYS